MFSRSPEALGGRAPLARFPLRAKVLFRNCLDAKAQFARLRIPLPRFQSSQMLTWEGPMKKQRPPSKVTLLVPPGGVDLASCWIPWHWKGALDVLSKDREVALQVRAPLFRRRGRARGGVFLYYEKAPLLLPSFALPPLSLPPSRHIHPEYLV